MTDKSKRGFAVMDPERQREIARKGGASVPEHLRSFSQDASSHPSPEPKAARPRMAADGNLEARSARARRT